MLALGRFRRNLLGIQSHIIPTALLPRLPVAGFAKKKRDDEDISSTPGRDNRISRLLKVPCNVKTIQKSQGTTPDSHRAM